MNFINEKEGDLDALIGAHLRIFRSHGEEIIADWFQGW